MADAEYDGFGGGSSTAGSTSFQRYINLAGAISSVALVIGLGYWGYKLAVRDVRGVPVIQALEGPMRVAPENPGGEVADYQGLAVNEVAAAGTAAPPPERLILAPRPVELTLEDVAGLQGLPASEILPAIAGGAATAPALAAEPPVESADPVEAAVAEALAEEAAAPAGPAPEGAVTRSLRPMPRPEGRVAAAPRPAQPLPEPVEIDAATLSPGTRLVQFDAFDTKDEAKAEWVRLQGRFADLLADKSMVVQAAESGGRTIFRLRAHGFEDEADARRFCAAFTAEEANCIPVAHQ
jgi:hypothetical protein